MQSELRQLALDLRKRARGLTALAKYPRERNPQQVLLAYLH
ncbi:hypothetical protein [Caldivirga maquilingensis]|nr:hypothetical protein [Caldivirga maquilingensis]